MLLTRLALSPTAKKDMGMHLARWQAGEVGEKPRWPIFTLFTDMVADGHQNKILSFAADTTVDSSAATMLLNGSVQTSQAFDIGVRNVSE